MRQLKITNQITNRDNDSLERYLLEISKVRLLEPEEEVNLAKRIKEGDSLALEMLVKANLRFVVSVAKQYQNQGLPLSDLINEGNLGLITAAQKFDETRGFKFISYAVWWIRQSIMQALVEQARIVRLPLNKIGSFNKINRLMGEFEQEFQREPTGEELAEMLEMTEKDVVDIVKCGTRHISIETPLGHDPDDGTLLDLLRDNDGTETETKLMKESLRTELETLMKILPRRDAAIVSCYYGLNGESYITLEEIGQRFDLTRERVRQIKERSLRRLRKASKSNGLLWYLGV